MTRGHLLFLLLLATGCASAPEPDDPRPVRPASSAPALDLGLPEPLPVPADTVLLEQLEAALDLRLRDEFDRFLDGRDPGELLEHATLTQAALDRGIFGPDALFIVGDELFDYEFRPEQGLGNGLAGRPGISAGPHPAPNLRRVHSGTFGGPDSHNCSSCHLKGGPDGAGNRTQNAFLRGDGRSTIRADERNPPHLLGLGPIAVLAREMTADLGRARAEALAEAASRLEPVSVPLASKGVTFGTIEARPDGSVDTRRIEGVDADLVVKPFGWKGHSASLPEIIEESFRIHMGLLSPWGQRPLRDGYADPDQGDGAWYDADRDGISHEVESGMVTTLAAYLAQLETPVIRPPAPAALLDRFARGRGIFDEIGCASCHRPALVLDDPVLEIRSLDPERAGGTPVRVDVARDGDSPKIEPEKILGTRHIVRLFSDLKRHDMGPELATPSQGSISASVFLTRPLWGLAFTSPYLHDGRAPTVDDAVRLHGGEAAPARDRYLALSLEDRASLQVFLLSLDREPKLFVP